MSDSHKGGCFCGAVRYETVGKPIRVSLCHCRYCQLRTGTAFGIGVYFNSEQITFNEGATDTYSSETVNLKNPSFITARPKYDGPICSYRIASNASLSILFSALEQPSRLVLRTV